VQSRKVQYIVAWSRAWVQRPDDIRCEQSQRSKFEVPAVSAIKCRSEKQVEADQGELNGEETERVNDACRSRGIFVPW
jgi:hypothetical protein